MLSPGCLILCQIRYFSLSKESTVTAADAESSVPPSEQMTLYSAYLYKQHTFSLGNEYFWALDGVVSGRQRGKI